MKRPVELPYRDDLYQVFLLSCPAVLPLSFASHPWFVINKKGIHSRWEIFWKPVRTDEHPSYLHKNAYPHTEGIPRFFFSNRHPWHGKLVGSIEGGEGSVAQQMANLIESTPQTYPHCHHYSITGPNSNTYAEWILDHFPNSGLELPWNAFGKNYFRKHTPR